MAAGLRSHLLATYKDASFRIDFVGEWTVGHLLAVVVGAESDVWSIGATRTATRTSCHAENEGLRWMVKDWEGRPTSRFAE